MLTSDQDTDTCKTPQALQPLFLVFVVRHSIRVESLLLPPFCHLGLQVFLLFPPPPPPPPPPVCFSLSHTHTHCSEREEGGGGGGGHGSPQTLVLLPQAEDSRSPHPTPPPLSVGVPNPDHKLGQCIHFSHSVTK